ncbi:PA14 domain-containing protein [Pseudobacteriovorax antillogorgiicola]|uniref:PA14 domain-containing protein n=1 Tax=Pseudobacteriovorax antillogorgiicola TaxID=1513793 RepID=A0A1Y6BEH0_9BACT|nr:PA14 domain-containing protein [Pseudobacteriovorax antillogorgiicola]TCS57270.1 PA14 domain-containing protein [Pseudobacteriovorax antillogorgiicola]SMF03221.1 PA14 domain-containing protein [Pseudobacteriovorax antillogorgiicola]
MVQTPKAAYCGLLGLCLNACSSERFENYQPAPTELKSYDADLVPLDQASEAIDADSISKLLLSKAAGEKAIETVVLNYNQRSGLSLAADENLTWSLDMEETVTIDSAVKSEKYLRVHSKLEIPESAEGRLYDIGCLFVELKDNVTYDKPTLLRIASTGIAGDQWDDVTIPLRVKRDQWKDVPILDSSLTLAVFEAHTVKGFDGQLCFQLDYSQVPAQLYSGQIVVQYLIAGEESFAVDDDLPPTQNYSCRDQPRVLKSGQEIRLRWDNLNSSEDYGVRLSSMDDDLSLGHYYIETDGTLVFRAPDLVHQTTKVFLAAIPKDDDVLPEFCEITLVPHDSFVVDDDGESQAAIGNVFRLSPDTQSLPNFASMSPVARVMIPNFDVPERRFKKGFPGLDDLFEWFGIQFKGRVYLEEACFCQIKLRSDDGAKLYMDQQLLIDNDGIHPTKAVTESVFLDAGFHDFRLDYFQGPRYHITLELLWDKDQAGVFEPIPPEVFFR